MDFQPVSQQVRPESGLFLGCPGDQIKQQSANNFRFDSKHNFMEFFAVGFVASVNCGIVEFGDWHEGLNPVVRVILESDGAVWVHLASNGYRRAW